MSHTDRSRDDSSQKNISPQKSKKRSRPVDSDASEEDHSDDVAPDSSSSACPRMPATPSNGSKRRSLRSSVAANVSPQPAKKPPTKQEVSSPVPPPQVQDSSITEVSRETTAKPPSKKEQKLEAPIGEVQPTAVEAKPEPLPTSKFTHKVLEAFELASLKGKRRPALWTGSFEPSLSRGPGKRSVADENILTGTTRNKLELSQENCSDAPDTSFAVIPSLLDQIVFPMK